MTDPLQIETAGLERDLEVLVRFQSRLARESEHMELDPDTVRAGIRHVFARPDLGFYLIARSGADPAGCNLILKEWSDWRNREAWWIHGVYVPPEFRRRGVFRALYRRIEALARQQGVFALRLYADQANQIAHETYRALGMTDQHYRLFERVLR